MSLQVKSVPITELTPDPQNVRLHDEKNLDAIKKSLSNFGQRKPIVVAKGNDGRLVVIAGNGTLEAAQSLGWTEIAVAEVPEDWDADKARAYAIADNRTGELASWNDVALASALLELDVVGWEISELGFTPADLNGNGEEPSEEDLELYTRKVNVPQYNVVGEEPSLLELTDRSKTKELEQRILNTDLPIEIKDFLIHAAQRHTVFNYQKIAEFYPHQNPEIQKLMEESALVIIDFDDAIKYGYVRLTERTEALEEQDRSAN